VSGVGTAQPTQLVSAKAGAAIASASAAIRIFDIMVLPLCKSTNKMRLGTPLRRDRRHDCADPQKGPGALLGRQQARELVGLSLAWQITASDLSRCGSNVGSVPFFPATGLRHSLPPAMRQALSQQPASCFTLDPNRSVCLAHGSPWPKKVRFRQRCLCTECR
jgi:hypothetical protein